MSSSRRGNAMGDTVDALRWRKRGWPGFIPLDAPKPCLYKVGNGVCNFQFRPAGKTRLFFSFPFSYETPFHSNAYKGNCTIYTCQSAKLATTLTDIAKRNVSCFTCRKRTFAAATQVHSMAWNTRIHRLAYDTLKRDSALSLGSYRGWRSVRSERACVSGSVWRRGVT